MLQFNLNTEELINKKCCEEKQQRKNKKMKTPIKNNVELKNSC